MESSLETGLEMASLELESEFKLQLSLAKLSSTDRLWSSTIVRSPLSRSPSLWKNEFAAGITWEKDSAAVINNNQDRNKHDAEEIEFHEKNSGELLDNKNSQAMHTESWGMQYALLNSVTSQTIETLASSLSDQGTKY